jgi:hypothetical protein
VASSNFDRFDKNMQDGSSISDDEGATATAAQVRLYLNTGYHSVLELPIFEDSSPPAISGVQAVNVTAFGATIVWTTDEPATSQVEYGTTPDYGEITPLDTNLVESHSVLLSSLAEETTYHYRVISRDAADNTTTSSDYTFQTADSTPPDPPENVRAEPVP